MTGHSMAIALPHDMSPEVRDMATQVFGLTCKYVPEAGADKAGHADIAEQKAMALVAVAAGEVAKMPDTPHRKAIIDDIAAFFTKLVERNEQKEKQFANLGITEAGMKRVIESGVGDQVPFPDMDNDADKPMPLYWRGVCHGVGHPPEGETGLLYYGKVHRLSKNKDPDDKTLIEEEERALNDIQERFVNNSVINNGQYAEGGTVERFDIFDPDTDEMVVMYRVPYCHTPEKSKGRDDAQDNQTVVA